MLNGVRLARDRARRRRRVCFAVAAEGHGYSHGGHGGGGDPLPIIVGVPTLGALVLVVVNRSLGEAPASHAAAPAVAAPAVAAAPRAVPPRSIAVRLRHRRRRLRPRRQRALQRDDVCISVDAIAAATGFPFWSATFDRKLTDVFAVESEISTQIGNAPKVRLLAPADVRRRGGTADPVALDAYFSGRQQYDLVGDRATYEAALAGFDAAIAADAGFAAAHAARAMPKRWPRRAARSCSPRRWRRRGRRRRRSTR